MSAPVTFYSADFTLTVLKKLTVTVSTCKLLQALTVTVDFCLSDTVTVDFFWKKSTVNVSTCNILQLQLTFFLEKVNCNCQHL